MKKLLIIFLVLVACTAAKAETWTDTNGTRWSFYTSDGNKVTITSISGTIPANLVIPSAVYIDETAYTVTSIGGSAFKDCTNFTSVTIPDGVTSIGSRAFWGCTNLASVTIPESVTTIDYQAFQDCSSLASIVIPDGVTALNSAVFKGCTKLTSITIPDGVTSIGSQAFYGCSILSSINIPNGVTSIGDRAFECCSSLTSITIPDGVTSIGVSAFFGCFSLTSITLPDGVTSIGDRAFYRCSSLTSITIPNSVTSIGEDAFFLCSGLKKVIVPDIAAWCGINFVGIESNPLYYAHHLYSDENTEITNLVIPDEITSINKFAFLGCSGLTSVTLGTSVTSIGDKAFRYCYGLNKVVVPNITAWFGITFETESANPLAIAHHLYSDEDTEINNLVIPEGITSIGDYAFYGASGLTSITIPNSVTSIGTYAFQNCSGLTSVTIPNSVTSIGTYAFQNCSGLTSITIPNSVTSIGGYAFQNCSGLTSITIPNSVTRIGDYVFEGCSSLTSIIIPENVTSISSNAFSDCPNLYFIHFESATPKIFSSIDSSPRGGSTAFLYVPDESVDAYKTAWKYENIIFPESTPTLFDMTLSAKEGSSDLIDQIGDANAYKVVQLKISGTFNGYDVMVMRNKMTNLRTLDMSDARVVSNPYEYYSGCNTKDDIITSYFLPTGIVSVKLPAGITALGSYAFSGCGSLKSIELPATVTSIGGSAFSGCSNLASVIIPEGVTSIGGSAFSGCSNLASVIIPEGVTSIGYYAFSGCSNLASVIIPDCVTLIGSSAFSNCRNLSDIHLPKMLRVIESRAFYNTGLTELHLPPYIESIADDAFSGCGSLKKIYAYMPGIIPIGSSTFSNYKSSELYIPGFLYNNYYYDTNWSQFISINKTSLSPDDYITLPTNDDITFADGEERIPDTSEGEHIDAEIGNEGGVTVEGDEPQPFDEVEQSLDGNGQGGSLIGEDDGENQGNLPVNTLNVKIQVKAGRWYFFCFPFDVTIAECEYPGQYAWREYDGLIRAMQGANGWKNVEGDALTGRQGYIFQSATAGTLVVKFDKPTFGGDRPKTLTEYVCDNAANASWNFVGNPYSSFYDFQAEDFDAPITVWNGNSYAAYRPGDDEYHLQPYEAFFVQKPNESEKIDFKKEKRETYRQSKEKKANNVKALLMKGITPSRLLVNLNISDNDTASVDKTRLVLNEKASRNYEMTCDAAKFISNDANAQLYTVEEKVEMAINERPTEGDIRLGYKAKKAGKLTIEAPRMDLPMELVDTKTGVTFDLSLVSYEF